MRVTLNSLFTDNPVALTFQIQLEFGNVGFLGKGKTGVPGEKPLGARKRTNNKPNPHMTPSPGIETGSHWWEANALTTAPSPLPQKHYKAPWVGSGMFGDSECYMMSSLHLSIISFKYKS